MNNLGGMDSLVFSVTRKTTQQPGGFIASYSLESLTHMVVVMICIIHSITGTTAKWSTSTKAKIRILKLQNWLIVSIIVSILFIISSIKNISKASKNLQRKDESKNCRYCCNQTIGLYSLFSLKSLQQLCYCCFCSHDHAGAQDPTAGGSGGGGGSPPPSPPPQQHRPSNIPKNKPTNKNTNNDNENVLRLKFPPNFHSKTQKKKCSLKKVLGFRFDWALFLGDAHNPSKKGKPKSAMSNCAFFFLKTKIGIKIKTHYS